MLRTYDKKIKNSNTVNLGYNKLGYKESSAIRNSFEIPESFPSLFYMKKPG